MKKYNIIGIVFIVLCALSCQQDKESITSPDTINRSKVERLVDRGTENLTGQDFDDFKTEYASLNSGEFNLFNELTANKMLDVAREKGLDVKAAQESLKVTRDLQMALNKESLSLYGMSYNQITNKQLATLIDNMERGLKESVGSGRVASCSCNAYPNAVSYAATSSATSAGYTTSTHCGSTDCDFEFQFNGGNYTKVWSSWATVNVALSNFYYNGGIASRFSGNTTYILFGAGRVNATGGAWWWNIALNMGS